MDDGLDTVVHHIGDPRDWTWVFDFDGVLSELVDVPDDAAPVEGARAAIAGLAERAEVALLSGRGVDDLAARLGGPIPGVLLVGGHGSEAIWPDGRREPLVELDLLDDTLREVADELTGRLDPADGWFVERKRASLAVHHRRVADADVEALLPWVRATLEAATPREPGFEVLAGKAVLELRPTGVDKGRALRWLVERSHGRPPLVFGDDVTDEEAFVAANAVGGTAVKVAEVAVDTAAAHRLRDPSRVVALLARVRDPARDGDPVEPPTPWAGTGRSVEPDRDGST